MVIDLPDESVWVYQLASSEGDTVAVMNAEPGRSVANMEVLATQSLRLLSSENLVQSKLAYFLYSSGTQNVTEWEESLKVRFQYLS
jgi:hypothetical protein